MRTLTTPIPLPENNDYVSVNKVTPETNTITLNDTTGLSSGDLLLVEEFGCEVGEVLIISSINGDEVVFTNNFLYEHPSNVPLNKVNYDEFVVERDDGNGFEEIFSGSIDYNNSHNNIVYVDDSAESSLKKSYRIIGVNSVTTNSDVLAEFGETRGVGWVTYDEIIQELNINESDIDESLILQSMQLAINRINDSITSQKIYDANSSDYSFIFNDEWFFHDFNADGVIDTDDLYVYELDVERDVAFFKNYLINKITNTRQSKRISFKKKLPKLGRDLKFFIPSTYNYVDDIKSILRRVTKLMITNNILSKSTNENLMFGVSSWSAGGTNVNRDSRSVSDLIKSNEEEINNILRNDLVKLRTWRTKLRRRGNIRDERYHFNNFRGW